MQSVCVHCGVQIQLDNSVPKVWYHVGTGSEHCNLIATPPLSHTNRHLDAATILAEMEARRPAPPPPKVRQLNPDHVEGHFEGEL
jgi:hypothetical protein